MGHFNVFLSVFNFDSLIYFLFLSEGIQEDSQLIGRGWPLLEEAPKMFQVGGRTLSKGVKEILEEGLEPSNKVTAVLSE